jgi:predicted metalloprotease with PDZ domain
MLGPFDYDREVHTHLLWAMEGFTEYYAALSLRRAGLVSFDDYLEHIGDQIQAYEKRPGRFVQSLSQSSFETWTKFYRPTADAANRQMSYYLKGELVGLCLDLEIRRRTDQRSSLDDVFKLLYQRYGRQGIGFPESVYQETVEEVATSSFQEFFDRYIESVDPLPLDGMLDNAGIKVIRRWKPRDPESGDQDSTEPVAWLGIEVKDDANHVGLDVTTSYSDGPAASLLSPGDRLVALNGYAMEKVADLEKRLQDDHRPGDLVNLHFFRRNHLETVPVVLGSSPPNQIKLELVNDLSGQQAALLRDWLHYAPIPPSV